MIYNLTAFFLKEKKLHPNRNKTTPLPRELYTNNVGVCVDFCCRNTNRLTTAKCVVSAPSSGMREEKIVRRREVTCSFTDLNAEGYLLSSVTTASRASSVWRRSASLHHMCLIYKQITNLLKMYLNESVFSFIFSIHVFINNEVDLKAYTQLSPKRRKL